MTALKKDRWLKIAVLGDGGVGKTALCLQLTEHTFEEYRLEMTIGANVFKYDQETHPFRGFYIFDLGGQDAKTDPKADVFVRGSAALILVYDITSFFSFMSLSEDWLPFIARHVSRIPIILVGNKLDIIDHEEVPQDLVDTFITENRARFNIEAHLRLSAKTGENIPELMEKVIDSILLYHRLGILE